MKTPLWTLILPTAAGLACAGANPGGPPEGAPELTALDAIFADFAGSEGPGCAFAVSRDGQQVMSRAYGMADLEWHVPNTPETVFEPGSVSKQFAAAATILLALDGRIDLDDDIRAYFPEMPDYGEAVTVRMLIHHTSGLRDWGSVASIEGWPRWSRVHSHKHALDIASRQGALNYEPGRYYSYTNTGYNLQAMLIERVTGQTFDEFSQERIFRPLGMTKTQWRDDFTEIVDERSVGYRRGEDGEWHMLMPFENVHGNGGLLTTVGDLLRFTRNLDTGEVGGPEFVRLMHEEGTLDSGWKTGYAGGLRVGEYKGVREVSHGGSTAAYRAFLTRYPDHGLAVSLMCNVAEADSRGLVRRVAELYLADAMTEEPRVDATGVDVDPADVATFAGGYRDTRTGQYLELIADGSSLLMSGGPGGPPLAATSETGFASATGVSIAFEGPASAGERPPGIMDMPAADGVRIEPVGPFEPTAADLAEYAGAYRSDEAEVTYRFEVEDGRLMFRDRYGDGAALEPLYPDAFGQESRTFIFRRDETGRVSQASLSEGRVWDLRFERVE
ncbi:MAG: beta-lactamase family protein [Gemmatimonadales bacterium]|uniref:serine hydrolase domain-containing protein n=1 Tax=Candidatus Palauibacter irciniicola TaxID=3056733 RepID=UPI00137C5EC3|nr:beta-lactamase family protein [Candidatus Palauibacter irciniicola]MYC17198.1 beta-lactamase family protein [Gemmatimonadales bacterium]